jgi:cell division protein FtsB
LTLNRTAMAKGHITKNNSKKGPSREQQKTRAITAMILFLSTAFLVFTSMLGDKSLFQLHRLHLERETWIKENSRQAQENEGLEKKILAAREDLFIVEKIAREDLGLVKKNEVVYLFDPEKIQGASGSNAEDLIKRRLRTRRGIN